MKKRQIKIMAMAIIVASISINLSVSTNRKTDSTSLNLKSVPYYTWPNSIYEVGKQIESSEDNFMNLFYNWNPQNIANAEEIKLLKYEFSQTISNFTLWKAYLDSVQAIDYPLPLLFSVVSNHKEESECEVRIFNRKNEVDGKVFLMTNEINEGIRKIFADHIHLGTKVYHLYIKHMRRNTTKKYKLFVFINPQTNRVIEDFFFTVVPLDFIDDKPQLET